MYLLAGYDPCCIPQKTLNAVLAATRIVLKTILVFIPNEESTTSECYLYIRTPTPGRELCEISVNNLPIVKDFEANPKPEQQ